MTFMNCFSFCKKLNVICARSWKSYRLVAANLLTSDWTSSDSCELLIVMRKVRCDLSKKLEKIVATNRDFFNLWWYFKWQCNIKSTWYSHFHNQPCFHRHQELYSDWFPNLDFRQIELEMSIQVAWHWKALSDLYSGKFKCNIPLLFHCNSHFC